MQEIPVKKIPIRKQPISLINRKRKSRDKDHIPNRLNQNNSQNKPVKKNSSDQGKSNKPRHGRKKEAGKQRSIKFGLAIDSKQTQKLCSS